MSSNYYFEKWKTTLRKLENLLEVDLLYQQTKAHDSNICEASERLTGVLADYVVLYNEAIDCLQHNTQVQKTDHIVDVVKAIVARILELKHALRKLDGSPFQFLANGAASHKLTTYDVEFHNILKAKERPEQVQSMIDKILEEIREEKEQLEHQEPEQYVPEQVVNWWELDEEQESINMSNDESEEILTEEMLQTRKMINLIKAHEKSRQVWSYQNHKKLKIEMWIKELKGTLQPPAPMALRERAAKFIQKACRAYFELKRKKIQESKRNQLLGIIHCDSRKDIIAHEADKITVNRIKLRKTYISECTSLYEKLKEDYVKRKGDEVKENYRDRIRDWFYQWYKEIQLFHDIPDNNDGGPLLIIKEELPSPTEWLEEYESYLQEQKANKGKSAHQLKWAKMEAKEVMMRENREEILKKKEKEKMLRKIMKNPTSHPGYHYPESKRTPHILKVLENYHKYWDELDSSECLNVKEKFVHSITAEDAYMTAKMELALSVGEDMREELKILRRALKTDYENNGEKVPQAMKNTKKKRKRKKRLKPTSSENITDKIHMLVKKNVLVKYPKTKMEDFLGDHNFAGADLRCNNAQYLPFAGEARNVWWERCSDMAQGASRILLVGPKGSGKITLVHVYSTLNDAVLFVLDPSSVLNDLMLSASYLQQLVTAVVSCAKAVQPSVIYIKHIHRLFYDKVPKEEDGLNLHMIKNYFVKKLCKRINKTDLITVIGSCIDPWLAKAKPLLKQFPTVVLMPDTSYSAVVAILTDWMAKNHTIPRDLDIQSLSFLLRGYSFGYLKQCLDEFLTPDRIVKIALNGLKAQDIYKYILDDGQQSTVEYENYLKWFFEKTHLGQKQKKHMEEQREFKMMLDLYLVKMKKRAQRKQQNVTNK